MLGDVGDPQPIWRLTGEHPLHQIAGSRRLMTGPRTPVTRQPLDRGAGHKCLDLVVADLQPQPKGQFGMNPTRAVGAP
jgi:hypothetical protein